MSTIKSDTLSTLSGAYSVPTETLARASCKAWVNFNGTGTVAIRRAFNVSSITDNGTGDYTVNFTNAMVDASYSAAVTGNVGTANRDFVIHGPYGAVPTTAAYRFICVDALTAGFFDAAYMNCTIFS